MIATIEQQAGKFYAFIHSGDFEGLLRTCSENIQWTVYGPQTIPYAGVYQGVNGVREFVRLLLDSEEISEFMPDEFIVDEAKGVVCVLGHETSIAKSTGKKFSAKWSQILRFESDQLVSFEEYIDTYALSDAYTSS